MNMQDFLQMGASLAASAKHYPNCRIANCDCDSKHGEWVKGCNCMCHLLKMDDLYGKDKWTWDQVDEEREKGYKAVV